MSPGRPPSAVRERARVDERLGRPDRHEVERDERAGGDREDRRVAGLPLAVRDRVAQRVVGRVEEEDDQEADQRRLVPDPPLPPRRLRPDRAGDQHRDAEDDRRVDRDVGAGVVDRVAAAEVADRVDAADDEAAEGDDRERHVQVEDLLDEALVGLVRRVEEDEREAGPDQQGREQSECPQVDAFIVASCGRCPGQSSRRKSKTAHPISRKIRSYKPSTPSQVPYWS